MQTVHYRAVVFDLDGTAVDSRYNIDALQLRRCWDAAPPTRS